VVAYNCNSNTCEAEIGRIDHNLSTAEGKKLVKPRLNKQAYNISFPGGIDGKITDQTGPGKNSTKSHLKK
jgi:hypothetical protein